MQCNGKHMNKCARPTKKIARALEQVTGKSAESDELIRMLNQLKEFGLVEIDMANIRNSPQLFGSPNMHACLSLKNVEKKREMNGGTAKLGIVSE